MRGMAEFIIAKHRNGSVGEIILQFRSELARFQDPDDRVPLPGETFVSGMGGGTYESNPSPEELASAHDFADRIPDPFTPDSDDESAPF